MSVDTPWNPEKATRDEYYSPVLDDLMDNNDEGHTVAVRKDQDADCVILYIDGEQIHIPKDEALLIAQAIMFHCDGATPETAFAVQMEEQLRNLKP